MANVPAHLRTDFKPTDADIRTLVQNVLSARKRLVEVRSAVETMLSKNLISLEDGEILLTIIDQKDPE